MLAVFSMLLTIFVSCAPKEKGEQVEQGIQGEKGDKGENGVGIQEAEINDKGELIVRMYIYRRNTME